MLQEWQDEVRAIAQDHLSPSSVLAERTSRVLEDVAAQMPAELPDVARQLARAQPAMAAVVSAVNVALRAHEQLGAASVGAVLQALRRGIDADRRAAAAALVDALDRPVRLVTFSASAAVIEAIAALQHAELLEDIVCAESRPLLEGTALARWLAEQGQDVTLCCDAAVGEHLNRQAIFVTGTDAILPQGIANKMGTRLVAAWAMLAGAERYVLATRDKLYPPALAGWFANPDRPAAEVVQKPPAGLRVANRAFDVTARDAWTRVWVGGSPLAEAEQRGDLQAARALTGA